MKKSCTHSNLAKDPLPASIVHELVQYWLAQQTMNGQRIGNQVCLTYVARGRAMEVANATIDQFRDRGVGFGIDWHLPRIQQKHGTKDEVIPLPESTVCGLQPAKMLRAHLGTLPADNRLVFRRTEPAGRDRKRDSWVTGEAASKPYSSNALLQQMRAALQVLYPRWTKEQIADIGTHSLRSGCVTQMYRAGATFIHGKKYTYIC